MPGSNGLRSADDDETTGVFGERDGLKRKPYERRPPLVRRGVVPAATGAQMLSGQMLSALMLAAMIVAAMIIALIIVAPMAPALGDPAPRQPPAAPVPQPATPADTPALTAAHVAKARQLIILIGVPDAFEVASSDAMAQIGAALTQAHPELSNDMTAVLDQLRPEFVKQTEDMTDVTARFYASVFSEPEIDTILAFFNSDAGRKWNAAQRDIYKQLTSGIQAWQQKVIVTMVARVRQEMKKKGHDL